MWYIHIPSSCHVIGNVIAALHPANQRTFPHATESSLSVDNRMSWRKKIVYDDNNTVIKTGTRSSNLRCNKTVSLLLVCKRSSLATLIVSAHVSLSFCLSAIFFQNASPAVFVGRRWYFHTMSHFNFWLSLSLSDSLSERLSQKLKWLNVLHVVCLSDPHGFSRSADRMDLLLVRLHKNKLLMHGKTDGTRCFRLSALWVINVKNLPV